MSHTDVLNMENTLLFILCFTTAHWFFFLLQFLLSHVFQGSRLWIVYTLMFVALFGVTLTTAHVLHKPIEKSE